MKLRAMRKLRKPVEAVVETLEERRLLSTEAGCLGLTAMEIAEPEAGAVEYPADGDAMALQATVLRPLPGLEPQSDGGPTIASLEPSRDWLRNQDGQRSVTIRARDVRDTDGIRYVALFRDSDGNKVFNPQIDQVLDKDRDGRDKWSVEARLWQLEQGYHRLFVRAKDNAGNWGGTGALGLHVYPPVPMVKTTLGNRRIQVGHFMANITWSLAPQPMNSVRLYWNNGLEAASDYSPTQGAHTAIAPWQLQLGPQRLITHARDIDGVLSKHSIDVTVVDTIRPTGSAYVKQEPESASGCVCVRMRWQDNGAMLKSYSVDDIKLVSEFGRVIRPETVAAGYSYWPERVEAGNDVVDYWFDAPDGGWTSETLGNWSVWVCSGHVRDRAGNYALSGAIEEIEIEISAPVGWATGLVATSVGGWLEERSIQPSAEIVSGYLSATNSLTLIGTASPGSSGATIRSFSWDVNGDGVTDATGRSPTLSGEQLAQLGYAGGDLRVKMTVQFDGGTLQTTRRVFDTTDMWVRKVMSDASGGAHLLASVARDHLVIVSLAPDGTPLWATELPDVSRDRVAATVDQAGNCYVTANGVLVKFTADGQVEWERDYFVSTTIEPVCDFDDFTTDRCALVANSKGIIYSAWANNVDSILIATNSNGEELWRTDFCDPIHSIVRSGENIIVNTDMDRSDGYGSIQKFRSDGRPVFTMSPFPPARAVDSNGVIYATCGEEVVTISSSGTVIGQRNPAGTVHLVSSDGAVVTKDQLIVRKVGVDGSLRWNVTLPQDAVLNEFDAAGNCWASVWTDSHYWVKISPDGTTENIPSTDYLNAGYYRCVSLRSGKLLEKSSARSLLYSSPIIENVEASREWVSDLPGKRQMEITAIGVKDDGEIRQVALYRDADGDGKFDPAVDQRLHSDRDGRDGWMVTALESELQMGRNVLFVRALDNEGHWGVEKPHVIDVYPVQPIVTSRVERLEVQVGMPLQADVDWLAIPQADVAFDWGGFDEQGNRFWTPHASPAEPGEYSVQVPRQFSLGTHRLVTRVTDSRGSVGLCRLDVEAIDTLRPTAVYTESPLIDVKLDGDLTLHVRYADNRAVSRSSIDAGDVKLVTQAGQELRPASCRVSAIEFTTPLRERAFTYVASYTFKAPGGEWTSAWTGPCTITMKRRQVGDTTGLYVPAGALGTINLMIMYPPGPLPFPVSIVDMVPLEDDPDDSIVATGSELFA